MDEEKDVIKRRFAQRFKELTKGYTNESLAEMFNVDIKTVEKWKNESSKSGTFPKTYTMMDICNEFNCDLNYLFMEDTSHFNKDYENASDITGLSDQALRAISNIENDIVEDLNCYPEKCVLNKNLFNYLLDKHPDFINQFLELIYNLLSQEGTYNAQIKYGRIIPENMRKNRDIAYQDNIDLQIVKVTRLLQNLSKEFDKDNFYEDIGYIKYDTDRQKRFDEIQDILNKSEPGKAVIPKELRPYYKPRNKQLIEIKKGGKTDGKHTTKRK